TREVNASWKKGTTERTSKAQLPVLGERRQGGKHFGESSENAGQREARKGREEIRKEREREKEILLALGEEEIELTEEERAANEVWEEHDDEGPREREIEVESAEEELERRIPYES